MTRTLEIVTPIGELTALFTEDAVRAVRFAGSGTCAGARRIDEHREPSPPAPLGSTDVGGEAGEDPHGLRERFEAYFAGERGAFDGLALEAGGTAFQESVWEIMRGIPFGEVRTYGSIADELGRRGASRAVGAASGANPIPVITPCHRVVGSDGSLTGFGGGLGVKRRLLEHEGVLESSLL